MQPTVEQDMIIGRNAVMEALRSNRPIDSVWVASGERSGSIGPILAKCRQAGIPIKETMCVNSLPNVALIIKAL